jgi:hypothetical protein
MKKLILLCAIVFLLSPAADTNSQPGGGCGPEDPTILCGFYCNGSDGLCWGPAPPLQACLESGYGCVDTVTNPCCAFWGGF